MIESLEHMSELDVHVVPLVRDAVEAELRRQIMAGADPSGTPWKLRKDGEKALQTAAKYLKVTAKGNFIVISVTGPIARHHIGAVKGGTKRQVIPSGEIPTRLAEVVRKAVQQALQGLN